MKHRKKKSSTKAALIATFAALLLSCTMLAGTTFAWFTDTATTGANTIQAGKLDVDLMVKKGDDYVSVEQANGTKMPLFGAENSQIAQDNNEDTLWEPGKTQVVYLAIQNKGNLAQKYQVVLKTTDKRTEEQKAEGKKELSEKMKYKIVKDAKSPSDVKDWSQEPSESKEVKAGSYVVSDNDVALGVGATHYFALMIHLDESADNAYQGVQVDFELKVEATQNTVEYDSFDNQYDKDALLYKPVNSPAQLKEVLSVTKANGTVTSVKLEDDTKLDEIFNIEGKQQEVSIDLSGKEITVNPQYDYTDGSKDDMGMIMPHRGHGSELSLANGKLVVNGNLSGVYIGEQETLTLQKMTLEVSKSVGVMSKGDTNIVDSVLNITVGTGVKFQGDITVKDSKVTISGGSGFTLDRYRGGPGSHTITIENTKINATGGNVFGGVFIKTDEDDQELKYSYLSRITLGADVIITVQKGANLVDKNNAERELEVLKRITVKDGYQLVKEIVDGNSVYKTVKAQ